MPLYDAIKVLSPPWLSTGTAEKLMFDIGLAADMNVEKINQAMRAHMPGYGTPTALTYIGNDRVLAQGPNETTAQFTRRIKVAFDTWDHAGSRRAVLEQVFWYFYNPSIVYPTVVPTIEIVGGNSAATTWDTLYSTSDPTQPPSHAYTSPANFNWDSHNQPWRAWLVLFSQPLTGTQSGTAASLTAVSGGFVTVTGLSGMTSAQIGQYLVISGAATAANNGAFQITAFASATSVTIANSAAVTPDANNGSITWAVEYFPTIAPAPVIGSPGMVIGPTATAAMTGPYLNAQVSIGLLTSPSTFQALRPLVRLWKSATTYYPWFIVSFGGSSGAAGSELSPISSEGAGNPDGTWGHWSKVSGGHVVAARSTGTANFDKFVSFVDGTGIYQNSAVPVLT